MEESSEVLFSIFGLKVTSQVTTMWGIMLVLVVISVLATRNLKEKPGKLQNLMEMAVSALKNFFAGLMGEDKAEKIYDTFIR